MKSLTKALGTDGIRKKIETVWDGNTNLAECLNDLKTALKKAGVQLDEAEELLRKDANSEADRTERPSHLVTALHGIRRFHHDLRFSIAAMNLTEANKDMAQQVVYDSCSEALYEILRSRKVANKQYESVIVLIGEVLKQEPKK